MQLKMEVTTLVFDDVSWFRDYKLFVERHMREGAKKFATAALSKIPVRTGFVAGSFGTLTDLLGSNARLNPVVTFVRKTLSSAKRLLPKRVTGNVSGGGEYYYGGGGKVLKTPQSGRQFATQAGEIFKWDGNTITFNYEVDITYFDLNDITAGHAPTAPWGAFAEGESAYRSYLEENLALGYPKVEDYITEKKVTYE